jgi:1,4-dihydroxy-2-naphthoyl-CoA hydrolase
MKSIDISIFFMYFCIMKEFKNTLMEILGIEITESKEGEVTATMPVNSKTCQIYGMLHGGATIALAESVAGYGSYTMIDQSQMAVGINVTANHLNAAKIGDIVIAKGTLIDKHQSIHVWNVDVCKSSGKLISTIRITNYISKKKE